jgi:hypothetical protein
MCHFYNAEGTNTLKGKKPINSLSLVAFHQCCGARAGAGTFGRSWNIEVLAPAPGQLKYKIKIKIHIE